VLVSGCGASARSSHAPEGGGDPARWARDVDLPDSALAGARLFSLASCLNCHTYDGDGSRNLGASDLTAVGRTGKPVAALARYVANPSRYGDMVMPRFGHSLSRGQLAALGRFLAASKGTR
jgi:mono/diheme cytochrome c family protein